MIAQDAKEIAGEVIDQTMEEIFSKIKMVAEKGGRVIVVSADEINREQRFRLWELGYEVIQDNRYSDISISWR